MTDTVLAQFRPALVTLIGVTIVTGFVYPAVVTVIAHSVFPHEAAGSLVQRNGRVVGSELVAQPFVSARYLWSRPSATAPSPWNAASSAGSNLGPNSPVLRESVLQRALAIRAASPDAAALPVDLLTASGSGIDPHISPRAALLQAPRIATARDWSVEQVTRIIQAHIEPRTWGVLGEPRVNVLLVNLALDSQAP